jgi:hypothetical protein
VLTDAPVRRRTAPSCCIWEGGADGMPSLGRGVNSIGACGACCQSRVTLYCTFGRLAVTRRPWRNLGLRGSCPLHPSATCNMHTVGWHPQLRYRVPNCPWSGKPARRHSYLPRNPRPNAPPPFRIHVIKDPSNLESVPHAPSLYLDRHSSQTNPQFNLNINKTFKKQQRKSK